MPSCEGLELLLVAVDVELAGDGGGDEGRAVAGRSRSSVTAAANEMRTVSMRELAAEVRDRGRARLIAELADAS
jgi:hypothetical protein